MKTPNPARLVRSPGWLLAFAVTVGICLVVLTANVLVSDVTPASLWGYGYGATAAALLAGAMGYAVRRRLPRHGPGVAHHWLQFHLYGGALFLLLLLMHTGFHVPHGALAWALWPVSLWIVLSGLLGALIQRWIPRVLTSGLATEVHYDRIPELVGVVRTRVETLVEACDESIRGVYRTHLAAALAGPQPRFIYFVDITGGIESRMRHLDYVRRFLTDEETQKVDELRALIKTKFEMDAQYTLQRALRGWLYGHVPLSLVLTVLVAVHILTVLYY